jgi:glycoside/pentoside/hexuronide:cation symporter, GPH family
MEPKGLVCGSHPDANRPQFFRPPPFVSPPPKQRETRPEDRVPLREKTALGLGFVTSLGSQNVIHVTAHSILNVTMGMSPALTSVILFLQRMWDVCLDPLVGQFSDNFRSRFGRRRPLLAVAVLPLAIFFAILWLVPRGVGHRTLFLYVLGWSLLFYTARSFYAIPLVGLQAEATPDYHERTRVTGFTQILFFAFAIIPNWLFALIQGPYVPDPVTAVHWMGIVLAGFFLLTGLLPVFFARERYYRQVASHQRRPSLVANLQLALRNRPFALILAMQGIFSFGYNIVGIFGMYTLYYYVYGGDIRRGSVMLGWTGTMFQVGAIASVFMYRWLSHRFGKRRALLTALGIIMAGSAAKWFLFEPDHPGLLLIVWFANGAGTTGISVLTLSMLADAADYEEWQSGDRREGLYGSMLTLSETIGYSFGALISGALLAAIGFDVKLGGGQSAHTLWLMRVFYVVLPFVGAWVAALVIRRYPLSEARAYEIKAELEQRRGQPNLAAEAG